MSLPSSLITLTIRSPSGVFALEDVSTGWSILELKASIAMRMNRSSRAAASESPPNDDGSKVLGYTNNNTNNNGSRISVESLRLISRGRVLQDDQSIDDFGMVDGQIIHVVVRQVGNGVGGGLSTPHPTMPTDTTITNTNTSTPNTIPPAPSGELPGQEPTHTVVNSDPPHAVEQSGEGTAETITEGIAEERSPRSLPTDTVQTQSSVVSGTSNDPLSSAPSPFSRQPPTNTSSSAVPSVPAPHHPTGSSPNQNASSGAAAASMNSFGLNGIGMGGVPPEVVVGISTLMGGLANAWGAAITPNATTATSQNATTNTTTTTATANTTTDTTAAAATRAGPTTRNANTTPPLRATNTTTTATTPSNPIPNVFDPSAFLAGAMPLVSNLIGNINLASRATASSQGVGPNTTSTPQPPVEAEQQPQNPRNTVSSEATATPSALPSGQGATPPCPAATSTTTSATTSTAVNGTAPPHTSSTRGTACAEASPMPMNNNSPTAAAVGILEAITTSVTTGVLPALTPIIGTSASSAIPFTPQQIQQCLGGLASSLQNPMTQTAVLAAIPAGIAAINGLAGAVRTAAVAPSALAAASSTAASAARYGYGFGGGASSAALTASAASGAGLGLGSLAGLAGLAGLGLASLTSLTSSSSSPSTSVPATAGASCNRNIPPPRGDHREGGTVIHHHNYYYYNTNNDNNHHGNNPSSRRRTSVGEVASRPPPAPSPCLVRVQLAVSASEITEVPQALAQYETRLEEERRALRADASLFPRLQVRTDRLDSPQVVIKASLAELAGLPAAVARLEAQLGAPSAPEADSNIQVDVGNE